MRSIRTVVLVALVWAWMVGCAAQQGREARLRGALDVMAQVVDPAYALAVDGCIARETLIVDAAERGDVRPLDADRMIGEVRVRCNRLRVSFDAIRHVHARAAELVEQGAIDEAQAQLDRIEQLWRDIQEGGKS